MKESYMCNDHEEMEDKRFCFFSLITDEQELV